MNEINYDKDLYDFFSKLIDDKEELILLKNIMSGVDGEIIIEEFIKSQGVQQNDQC